MTILNKSDVKSDVKNDSEKARIDDDIGFWLNKTRSGKGVIIVIEEQAFISSLKSRMIIESSKHFFRDSHFF